MENDTDNIHKCPVTGAARKHSVGASGTKNRDWWPNQLNNPPSKKVDLKSPYKGPNSRLCCSSMRSCFS